MICRVCQPHYSRLIRKLTNSLNLLQHSSANLHMTIAWSFLGTGKPATAKSIRIKDRNERVLEGGCRSMVITGRECTFSETEYKKSNELWSLLSLAQHSIIQINRLKAPTYVAISNSFHLEDATPLCNHIK